MKKLITLFLTLIILISFCACGTQANVDAPESTLNPSIAERDKAIEEAAKNWQKQQAVAIPEPTPTPVVEAQDSIVLYDDNNIFIEYRGLKDYYSKDVLYIMENNLVCNRVNLRSTNGLLDLPADSVFLAYPNYHFVIDYEDLKEYDVKKIETIDFELEINKGSWFGGENVVTLPVHIDVDFPIP